MKLCAIRRHPGRAAPLVGAVLLATTSVAWAPLHAAGRVTDAPASMLAQDVQEIPIQVTSNSFDPNWVDVQTGPVRLAVTTRGGPYTLTIDPLVDPRALPADTTTYVGFDAPSPGEFTIQLTGTGSARATLNVTQPGF
jgi:hypothetical protein